MTAKYKKGDLVLIDDAGRAREYEIMSHLVSNRSLKIRIGELCYEAKDVANGETRTISEDEILRLATPVDNSAQLFQRSDSKE
ncbi:MAG: hypothetical protein ACYC7D_00190 [Nitrososphaerales archaeon]